MPPRTSYTVNADPDLHLDVRIRALSAELELSQGKVLDRALAMLEEKTERMALADAESVTTPQTAEVRLS